MSGCVTRATPVRSEIHPERLLDWAARQVTRCPGVFKLWNRPRGNQIAAPGSLATSTWASMSRTRTLGVDAGACRLREPDSMRRFAWGKRRFE